ncbi:MAG: hypothetical protein Q8T13_13285 [Acidobacteriota bacterium]|nr:hypothetical protein [Acidobacteriota bacterium]
MNRRSLLLLAAILAAVAVLLAASGGVRATVGGLRISARFPLPTSIAALAAVGAWWLLARRAKSVDSDLESAWLTLERHGTPAIILVAAASGTVATIFATSSAAGADASGYLSQAAMWERGGFTHIDELALTLTAIDPWITSPLGWRPMHIPWMQAPTYPPGLPWLMSWVPGTSHPDWVVMLSAAAAVCATGVMAVRLSGPVAGMLAAMLLAISPVFLFQSVQPMSDVPVTAAWMTCWALLLWPRARFAAGIACAFAVLIRPNLAPLAAVPLFAIGWHLRRLAGFSLPVVIAAAILMFLQNMWYGSPLRSGYGTADELFALSNIGANASRYFSWLMSTSPMLLVAPVGAALVWRHAFTKPLAAFSALVVAAYLVYAVFDVWSYLRFLLPAMAIAAVFAAIAIAAALRRLPAPVRVMAALAAILGIAAHGISQARALDTFRLADQQRRVAQVARFLSTTLPADGVIVSGEQSGALRYYTGRSILRWDLASPDALAAALIALNAADRPVVVALDAWEHEPFRARLGALPAVSLEWPSVFDAGTSHRTRVWRLSDRVRFLRGEQVQTLRQP